jgi:hypothetical protein
LFYVCAAGSSLVTGLQPQPSIFQSSIRRSGGDTHN